MVETQKYWFAARTRDKQEFAIGKFLEKLKSNENLDIDYYLPTKIVMDVGCFLIVRLKDGILTCIFPKILSIKKQV